MYVYVQWTRHNAVHTLGISLDCSSKPYSFNVQTQFPLAMLALCFMLTTPCLVRQNTSPKIITSDCIQPTSFVIMIHEVIGKPRRIPLQSACHLRKALSLDQVVEWERWKHGSIPVHVCFDEKSSTANSVKVDSFPRVAVWICRNI